MKAFSGERPMIATTIPPTMMATISAATGDRISRKVERFGRASRSMRMAAPPAHARHQEADLFAGRPVRCERRRELAGMNDRDPVANLEELVEVLTDDQHRGAFCAKIEQGLADGRGRGDIDAPGRLIDHQNGRP